MITSTVRDSLSVFGSLFGSGLFVCLLWVWVWFFSLPTSITNWGITDPEHCSLLLLATWLWMNEPCLLPGELLMHQSRHLLRLWVPFQEQKLNTESDKTQRWNHSSHNWQAKWVLQGSLDASFVASCFLCKLISSVWWDYIYIVMQTWAAKLS